MDIKKREWRTNPPRREVDTLEGLVFDFKWRFPRDRRDMVVEYCREAYLLSQAVDRACASRTSPEIGGKMHNHQSRVPEAVRRAFAESILEVKGIRRQSPDFDSLFDLLEARAVPGIGPVTLYDVATRVGAFLGVEPTSLYLHAGVRQGVRALDLALPSRWNADSGGLAMQWNRIERIRGDVVIARWPEFVGMPPDEVEDFMCTYRSVFSDLAPEGD